MRRGALRRLVPRPWLALAVALGWVLLAGSLSLNTLVFAALVGLVLPRLIEPFWPETIEIRSAWRAAEYFAVVAWDIVKANFVVARIVLFLPRAELRPAWIAVPLRLTNAEAIAVLAGTITLTPGTLTADLSADGRALLVHCLHAPDPDAVRAEIRDRYEARLLEFMQ